VLLGAEIEMTADIAVQQRTGGHHFRIQPGMARNMAMEDTAMAVGPIHHGRNADLATAVNTWFSCHGNGMSVQIDTMQRRVGSSPPPDSPTRPAFLGRRSFPGLEAK
jgi:hypothetical protein